MEGVLSVDVYRVEIKTAVYQSLEAYVVALQVLGAYADKVKTDARIGAASVKEVECIFDVLKVLLLSPQSDVRFKGQFQFITDIVGIQRAHATICSQVHWRCTYPSHISSSDPGSSRNMSSKRTISVPICAVSCSSTARLPAMKRDAWPRN